MTKRIAIAIAAATALAVPAVAQAELIREFKITATPGKSSTKKKKYPITLKAVVSQKDTTGALPPTLTNATLLLPPGSTWNGDLFPKCAASKIDSEKSTEDCPEGSVVGKGAVAGGAPGGIVQDDVTIIIANGGKSTVNMFVEGTSPLRLLSNIEVKLVKQTGKFGLRADIPVPEALQEPAPGVPVSITDLSLTLGKSMKIKGKTRGIIEVTKCTGGKWFGQGKLDFRAPAESFVADQTLPCKKG
ncbi:MAG: hypothetical protein JHC95_13470 [Solirubrobacteraceae bacterium]|nr:hypothetical protein [Solirubrobacteraceae bacterium]